MTIEDQIRKIETRLTALEKDRSNLLNDLKLLRAQREKQKSVMPLGRPALLGAPESNDEKAELFLTLFRGREDIYSRRWENNKTNKSGYSPVCENEWVKPFCQKPTIKCSDCSHQKFSPLNTAAVGSHLRGVLTIGTYAI